MNNIILIGMPGVGKSSLGVILAKELGMRFLDSDLIIQEREQRLLREILEQDGIEGFLAAEERVNASIEAENAVIATGGSAVYSEKAMQHLKALGTVVYLKLEYEQLSRRLGNLHNRGVVLREGQTLMELFAERAPLYEKYADLTVDEGGRDMEKTLEAVKKILDK